MCTDDAIVELFWERDENGIKLLQKKYGHDLTHISYRILNNMSDAEECIISDDNVETEVEYKELSHAISAFLKEQKKEYRYYFIERYWYAKTIQETAEKYHATDKKVESVLYRCRRKLRLFLVERGYFL